MCGIDNEWEREDEGTIGSDRKTTGWWEPGRRFETKLTEGKKNKRRKCSGYESQSNLIAKMIS